MWNKAISKLNETKTKKEEAIAKIKEFDDKINRLSDEYKNKNSKLKFLETEKRKRWIHEERKIFIVSMWKWLKLKLYMELWPTLFLLIRIWNCNRDVLRRYSNIVTQEENDAKD